MNLTALPVEILILILDPLGIHELAALCLTSRALHSLVTEYGWSLYLHNHPRPAPSLTAARAHWCPHTRVRFDALTDAAWSAALAQAPALASFIARPLSRTWAGKLQPVLALSPARLVVAAGSTLYSYAFGASGTGESAAPRVYAEGAVSLLKTPERPRNITAITFVEDGAQDRTLDVAFQDGSVERVYLTPTSDDSGSSLSFTRYTLPPIPHSDFIESFSAHSTTQLSLSANGTASLHSTTSPSPSSPTSSISLATRSWTALLSLTSSTPYTAFGSSSRTPLAVHALSSTGALLPRPLALLHTARTADLPADRLPSSAVYGLARGPIGAPWGASPMVLAAGWYDGKVRVYDLRAADRCSPFPFSSSPSSPLSTSRTPTPTPPPAPLRPMLTLADRWSPEPIYALACGGGGGAAHIAAGTARHSVVAFWDARAASVPVSYLDASSGAGSSSFDVHANATAVGTSGVNVNGTDKSAAQGQPQPQMPGRGWSVHAPGNDASPVYALALESARVWGVTQSRPFVYDFVSRLFLGWTA
ncbi:hypothetical protein JR316_0006906 [Psilocybe cubensis]|uniref:Uncharacterized protein n=1 Tax=Psilocybe cubensis TaxID=181762 RepID=A0ACB8GXE6_PSICU|nr:hypothetical protein JR316_0006906 [Psilocybe cubensis]KAH9480308.1 hypothetical protein JR316_0006906 [Psilocybe cubensis]